MQFSSRLLVVFFRTLLAGLLTQAAMQPAYAFYQVTESFTEPFALRQVAASEPGAVSKVFVEEGQRVGQGQALAEQQASELRQKLKLAQLRARAEHEVNSAQAKLEVKGRQRDALVPMLEQGHANPAEVEQANLEYEIAFADLQAAELKAEESVIQCALIEAEIEKRTIRSPIDGFVTEIFTRDGEYISASQPAFASVAQLDQLRVRFYLLVEEAEHLREGQQVSLLLHQGKPRSCVGKVHFISPITDPDSGTTRVEVVIANPELKIRSGIPCSWDSTL